MCNLSINTLSTATIPYSQIQATNPTTNLTKRHNHQVRNSRKICLERLQSPNHRAAKHTISLNFKQTPNRGQPFLSIRFMEAQSFRFQIY